MRKAIKSFVYNLCRFRMSTKKKCQTQTFKIRMVFNILFDDMKNRPYFCRGKDCIKKFCKDLKKLGMKIINFEEKKVIPLTNKQMKSYETQKVCHICKEKFCNNKNKKRSLSLHQKI